MVDEIQGDFNLYCHRLIALPKTLIVKDKICNLGYTHWTEISHSHMKHCICNKKKRDIVFINLGERLIISVLLFSCPGTKEYIFLSFSSADRHCSLWLVKLYYVSSRSICDRAESQITHIPDVGKGSTAPSIIEGRGEKKQVNVRYTATQSCPASHHELLLLKPSQAIK